MDKTDVLTYQTTLADHNRLMQYMHQASLIDVFQVIDDNSLIENVLPLWIHLSHLCDDVS